MAELPIEYHAQVLAQSRLSFTVSLAAAIVGFATLIGGVVGAYLGELSAAIVTVAGGAISEIVAALFFRQANRARELMASQIIALQSSEETRRRNEERVETALLIGDEETRDKVLAQLVALPTKPSASLDP